MGHGPQRAYPKKTQFIPSPLLSHSASLLPGSREVLTHTLAIYSLLVLRAQSQSMLLDLMLMNFCTHVPACGGQKSTLDRSFLHCFSTLGFEAESLTGLTDLAKAVTSEHQRSSHLCFLGARIPGTVCSDEAFWWVLGI